MYVLSYIKTKFILIRFQQIYVLKRFNITIELTYLSIGKAGKYLFL